MRGVLLLECIQLRGHEGFKAHPTLSDALQALDEEPQTYQPLWKGLKCFLLMEKTLALQQLLENTFVFHTKLVLFSKKSGAGCLEEPMCLKSCVQIRRDNWCEVA